MKKFNEWLSFRSNSYQESENAESASAFDFHGLPTSSMSSSLSRAEDKFKGLVDRYGGPNKIKKKVILLSEIIKDIYDFSDPNQLSKIKTDLRNLLNHLQTNNNLDHVDDSEDSDEEELDTEEGLK